MELDIHRIQQYRQQDDGDLISDYVIFESLGEKGGVRVQRITAGPNEYRWRDDIQIYPRYDLYFLSDIFVGYILTTTYHDYFGWIEDLHVAESYRGTGIGRELVTAYRERNPGTPICVQPVPMVETDKAALERFYWNQGFGPIKNQPFRAVQA